MSPTPSIVGGDLDNDFSIHEETPEEEIIVKDLSVTSPLDRVNYMFVGKAVVFDQKEVKKMKKSIASNLLYYSE
jgi:hypothetical protein